MPKPLLTLASTLRPALWLSSALLLTGCSLLSKDKSIDPYAAAAANGPPSFQLEIIAPDEVRKLLEQHLELQRYRNLPDLRRGELTRLLGAADANVRELIGTLGYFAPTIELQLIETPGDGATTSRVVVTVDPGPVTHIETAQVDFSGDNADDPKGASLRRSVERNWPLEPGARFTQDAWAGAKADGLKRLQARRYPTARLSASRADIDAELHQAQTQVTYDTGPGYVFGPLVIEGAERYNPSGPIRVARLPVGEEYRLTTMLDAQQRLASTGYYESVFLTLYTDAANPGDTEVQAPVIAQVREAPLQKWIYGLGFSTDSGARLSIDHTHNRIPWLEWRALSKLQLDKKNPLLSTKVYSMPDYSGWNWFFSGKAERTELADYKANSLSLNAGRSKNEDAIDRTYFLQYDYAKPQGLDAPPGSSSITANYGWTGRYFNNPTNPTRGHGLAFEVGAGTTLTPEREPFGRVLGRWQYFRPMARDEDTKRRSRLVLRAQGGAVLAKDDTVVPITQLFLSGGDTTVRGYSYQSIGAHNVGDQLIGGRYMASGSIEWQRPITIAGNSNDWEHTVFVDAGTVADKLAETVLYTGVGTGVRWNSPVGPLQADLAYGLKTQGLRLHLRLGFNF